MTAQATPAALYLANLSEGSQGMRQTLDIIAGILDDAHDADSFPWQSVTYREPADVENIRVSDLLSGRTLAGDEIANLFDACAADPTPKGARDAAMLAVFYGCGLRRGELARLDLDDFDVADGSIEVQGKRRKQRAVYLTEDGCRYLEAWIKHRGEAPGPLFCPVGQTGEVRVSRMRGESSFGAGRKRPARTRSRDAGAGDRARGQQRITDPVM